MACRRIGDKPLSEPMMTRITDAYMRHEGRDEWKGRHPRGHRGWSVFFFFVVVTFNHVGDSLIFLSSTTGDVWKIPSFRIWGYVLHVEHVSRAITNCGQHQWDIPSHLSIALYLVENITENYFSNIQDCSWKFALPDCFPCIFRYLSS